jgi:hypothetical protein
MSTGAIIAVLVAVEAVLVLAAIRYMVQGIRSAGFSQQQSFALGPVLSLPTPRDGSPFEEDRAGAAS